MSTADPITDEGEPHIERARLIKATKIAARIEALFGTQTVPSNEAVRIAAQILATEGEIADRPQSDRTCEIVRAVLATRDAMFTFADATAKAHADREVETAEQVQARENDEARALLEQM